MTRSAAPLLVLALAVLVGCAVLVAAGTIVPKSAPRHHSSHHGAASAAAAAAPDAHDIALMHRWRSHRKSEIATQFSLVNSGLESWSYGQNALNMSRPEGLRTYFIYVPKSYDSSNSHPVSLVLALHGLGDEAVDFATGINMTGQAEAFGFILVYPQGSTSILGTSWNAGTCCANQNVDDVTFLNTIVLQVQATFAIRGDSIHSMGFSNGGFMSERLGCAMADVFTSIASVSGDTILEPGNAAALKACDAIYTSPTSILHIHGNADIVVPWTGDALLGFPPIPDNIAAWVARNGCGGQPVQTLNEGTFTNQRWTGCADGNTVVELVKNQGGAHVYPQSSTGGFDTTSYLLAFWNAIVPGGL